MKCQWWIASLVLLLAGCQQDSGLDLVERDMRLQEDRIYQLQDWIREYQEMLESCRRENQALKADMQTPDSPERHFGPAPRSPRRTEPTGPAMQFEPPTIDPGIPTESPEVLPPQGRRHRRPAVRPASHDEPSDGEVAALVLNKMLTGGLNTDGRSGDEGIMVVVEPRTAEGEIVHRVGELSLMVVDPAKTGPEGQIARWDFTPKEAAAAWRKSLLGRGMHFELPWPGDPPTSEQLRLYVRLITPDGRKFIADTEIGVEPGSTRGQGPQAWSTRPMAERESKPAGDQWSARQVKIPEEDAAPPPRDVPIRTSALPDKPAAVAPVKGTEKATPGRPKWEPYR